MCWHGFTPFLDDSRICLTSSAAERSLRGFALGRKSRLFAASDLGADRAAVPLTWPRSSSGQSLTTSIRRRGLPEVLTRIADTPIIRLEELLQWKWASPT